MSTRQKDYDSTVARIAGNLLSGHRLPSGNDDGDDERKLYARRAVAMARAIVAETKRTEPEVVNG